MDILRRLTPRDLEREFDPETTRRGLAYARSGAVRDVKVLGLEEWGIEATALVQGTRTAPYTVVVSAELHDRQLMVESSCTCPVAYDCKHGVALALALADLSAATTPTTSWDRGLADLFGDLADLAPATATPVGVALELSLDAPRHGHRTGRPRLHVRPLRPGARQKWVKTGLGWTDVAGARLRREYDPGQLEVLARMHTSMLSTGGHYWYGGGEPGLEAFGPGLLGLLREALEAGVELLVRKPLLSVELSDDPARLRADVREHEGGTRIRLGLDHRGVLRWGDDVTPYGDPAHTMAVVDDGHVLLAPLVPQLTHGPLRALARTEPVDIPAEAGAALPEHLQRLASLVEVGSTDPSAPLPERLAPRLSVTVTWDTAATADVCWEWCYGEHAFLIDGSTPVPVLRDRAAERAMLERVSPPPTQARQHVTGPDALHLALLELPVWRAVDGLEVVEVAAPDFREAEEGPEISFEVVEPTDADVEARGRSTDWLDLEVLITVEGERVMLAHVIEALTLGHEHVVLPSGLYVRADRPEFARLDEVVRAAGQLHERDGDRRGEQVRVGRDDLGVWGEIGDLGVVDPRGEEWVRRAQALRDLVTLPTPEPTGIVSTLRGYQLDGFHWLAFLWQHGLGGVLADDMGLGKTLQVLALVAHTRATDDRPFLVVAPTSVVSAWEGQAATHAPGLRVRAVTSSAARRHESIAEVAADADVVVTTYTLLRLESEHYAAITWSGLVLDEAQQVKNHRSKAYAAVRSIDSRFRVAVTGTPFENRLLELWSLLSIVAPGLYPRARSFVDHVVRPVEKEGDAAALRRLTRRIKPFVLRRTKELVADDLPPKQEQVLAVELGAGHRKVYDTHLAKERQRILGLVEDFDRNRVAILAALTKLRQLALDPALVDADLDQLGSAKLDVLVEHLREISAEGHRALVFSQFTGFLRRVHQRLATEGIEVAYLDGATQRRGAVVEAFRSGSAPVFLISLKAGGTGLTLTEADYVFVLDPWWNPAAEAQAVDRAHRIGQTRTVMVYRLVATDTIEEKVMALKARKAALFAQVVDGEEALSEGIGADDIRSLFDE